MKRSTLRIFQDERVERKGDEKYSEDYSVIPMPTSSRFSSWKNGLVIG